MQRRTGLTLVEVLVAIFIMGIGLIALLTLFPIGILRMAQAIRDERTAQAGISANSIAVVYDVRRDPLVISASATEPDLFSNPGALLTTPLKPADPLSESYPVLADPIGRVAFTGVAQEWAGQIAGYLRRRPVSFLPSAAALDQNFKLWDDITFDSTFDPTLTVPASSRPGTPKILAPSNPLAIQRDPRYSWAYLLRRPQTQDRTVVDCAVVVFDKRATLNVTESVYADIALFDPAKNTILIDLSGAATVPPNIRPGDWIYDCTFYASPATIPIPANRPNNCVHSYFYRVVAAEDIVAGGKKYAKYEVQTPLRGFVSGPSKGCIASATDPITGTANAVYVGSVMVMEGVAEVFEKGPVQLP